jgi:NADH-quinone oxidoreductase subunit N
MLTPGQTLWLLSPELVLLLAALLVLGLDALRPRWEGRWRLPHVALAGLGGALIATISLWGCHTRVLYALSCDGFALVVKMFALVAVGLIILLSDAYVQAHSRHEGEFYALLLFSALAICLLGAAINLVMIFLAFDLLSITSYILTGCLRDDRRSTEAAIKYSLYGAALSAVMLYGMSWIYGMTGSTDLSAIAAALGESESALRPVVLPGLILMMAGLAFQVAAVPFHQWAPDVYEGTPTPVTAFISVGPTLAGFALLVRVLLTALPVGLENLAVDWRVLLMALAVLTMTLANLVALWQTNVKRLLAYSSIAQAGYALIGVVPASEAGVTAVLLHLAAYLLANVGAFAVVIAVSEQGGSDNIEEYAGLSRRAPLLALALLLCLLSLGGIPPLAGFTSRLYLSYAAVGEGLPGLAAVGAVNSVVSLAYYWKIVRAMYLTPTQTRERLTTSSALAAALGMTVAGVLVVGTFPGPLLALIQTAAQTLFGG